MNGLPTGVCVDMNGLVSVACGKTTHSIQIFDPRQNFSRVQTLGSTSGFYSAAPGKFHAPSGVCVDDVNTLIVADSCNNRIQAFK